MRTVFPYLVMFVLDNLIFPIIFIGSWFLFAEHAILLFIINLFKKRAYHIIAVILVAGLQVFHCIKVCNDSSHIGFICASFVVLPLWVGYLLSHLKTISLQIVVSCIAVFAFLRWIFLLPQL